MGYFASPDIVPGVKITKYHTEGINFLFLAINPSIFLAINISIFPAINPSIFLAINQSIFLTINPSIKYFVATYNGIPCK